RLSGMRGASGSKAALITLLALAIVLVPNHLPNAVASGSLQPSTFYFHNQATKSLNTISTYLWANTSQTWSSGAQFESRNVVSGTPGVWNFYSQPSYCHIPAENWNQLLLELQPDRTSDELLQQKLDRPGTAGHPQSLSIRRSGPIRHSLRTVKPHLAERVYCSIQLSPYACTRY